MVNKAIPDIISVIGPAYFQPIADLISKMLEKDRPSQDASKTSFCENGYAASIVVLLVVVLESFVGRLKFCRADEVPGGISVPALLLKMYPDLNNQTELNEVFLVRNSISHNHIWNIDVQESPRVSPTLKTPHDFNIKPNQHFDKLVDKDSRTSITLKLNVSPTSVDREDVYKIFKEVWSTLLFMNKKSYSVTPLTNDQIGYDKKRIRFYELIEIIEKRL